MPKYFILFDAVVHGFSRFLFLKIVSLLVYRNAIDFCILILYPATLLNLFISSNNFGVENFGVFYIQYHVTYTQGQYCFFPSSLGACISFPGLMAVPRISNIMLNRSGKSGHYLIPDLRGKAFSFSSLSVK